MCGYVSLMILIDTSIGCEIYFQHILMTSSNGDIFRVTGPLWEEFTRHRFPSQRPATRSFDVFFDMRLKKNGWVNNRDAGDLRRHRTHYNVTLMLKPIFTPTVVNLSGWNPHRIASCARPFLHLKFHELCSFTQIERYIGGWQVTRAFDSL